MQPRQYPNLEGLTASFTGHRPDKLGGYSEHVDMQLIALATKVLYLTKPAKVISGMALGWDMAVAYAAIVNKIPVVAAVPFKGQESMWPGYSQTRYHNILARCSEVVIVCKGEYSPAKMQIRNEWMVNHGDHLIGLWDGSRGGTYNCVSYAQGRKVPFLNVWAEWQQLLSNVGEL